MLPEQPNQILENLVVHAAQPEIFEIEDNADIVDDFLEALLASVFLKWYIVGNIRP